MKFTQLEIVELKKISATENVAMSFKLDGEDSIDYDFVNNKSVQSIIKKDKDGFTINATNSDGTDFHASTDNFVQFKIHVRNWIRAIKRDNPFELERLVNIDNLSIKFYDVFREATIIDELGFNESSGMIYRKALEFVVKDFFKSLLPDYLDIIEEKTIGQIIFHFYDIRKDELAIKEKTDFNTVNEELRTIRLLAKKIRNTFKIGNDFSHYERKLSDFTAKDMKSSIMQIISFIDSLIKERKLQMNRTQLDNEFKGDKLL